MLSSKPVQRRQSMPVTHTAIFSTSNCSNSPSTSATATRTPVMRRATALPIPTRHSKDFLDKDRGGSNPTEPKKRKEDQDRQDDSARYKAAAARTARGNEILQGVSPQGSLPTSLPQHHHKLMPTDVVGAVSGAAEEAVEVLMADEDEEDHNNDSSSCHSILTTTTTATNDTEVTSSRSFTRSPTFPSPPLHSSATSTLTLTPALIRRFSCVEGSVDGVSGPGSISLPMLDPVLCQDEATRYLNQQEGDSTAGRLQHCTTVDLRDLSPSRKLFPRVWDLPGQSSVSNEQGSEGSSDQQDLGILQQQCQLRRQSVGCLRDILVRKSSRTSLLSNPFVGWSDALGSSGEQATVSSPISPSLSSKTAASTNPSVMPPPPPPPPPPLLSTLSNCSSIESFPRVTRERASSSSLRMQFIRDLFVATASSAVNSNASEGTQEKISTVDRSRRNSVSSHLTTTSTTSSGSSGSNNSNGIFSPVLQRLPRLRNGTSGSQDSPLRSCVTSIDTSASTVTLVNNSTTNINYRTAPPSASNTSTACPSPILRLMKSISNLSGISNGNGLPSAQTSTDPVVQSPSTMSTVTTRSSNGTRPPLRDNLFISGQESTLPVIRIKSEPSASSELDLNWTLLKRQLQLQQQLAQSGEGDDEDDEDDDENSTSHQGSTRSSTDRPQKEFQQYQRPPPKQQDQARLTLTHNKEPLYSPTIVNEIWFQNANNNFMVNKRIDSNGQGTITPDLVPFQNYHDADDLQLSAEPISSGDEESMDDTTASAWTSWATMMQTDRERWAESLARTTTNNVMNMQLNLKPNKTQGGLEPHQLDLPPLLFSSTLGECGGDGARGNSHHNGSRGDRRGGDLVSTSLESSPIIRDFYGNSPNLIPDRDHDIDDIDDDDDNKRSRN
ncbi:hypothetical protein BGZ83_012101 [Gryganskiella cystojenkinii]|nr:hypothetical protein BGZ83_012101 [Gryganskiella cystojenkinii]